MINSRLGRFAAAPSSYETRSLSPERALLLPKLRSQYAEFLNHGFPDRLGMFYPPTCVGFGTGSCNLVRSFSRQRGSLEFDSSEDLSIYHFSASARGFASLPAYRLRRTFPIVRSSFLLCHSILIRLQPVLEFSPVVHRLCFLPRLRSRLTLSRRALLRKP